MREYFVREAAVFEPGGGQGGQLVGGAERDGDRGHVRAVLSGGGVEGQEQVCYVVRDP